ICDEGGLQSDAQVFSVEIAAVAGLYRPHLDPVQTAERRQDDDQIGEQSDRPQFGRGLQIAVMRDPLAYRVNVKVPHAAADDRAPERDAQAAFHQLYSLLRRTGLVRVGVQDSPEPGAVPDGKDREQEDGRDEGRNGDARSAAAPEFPEHYSRNGGESNKS